MYVYIKPCAKKRLIQAAQFFCGKIIIAEEFMGTNFYKQYTNRASSGHWVWNNRNCAALTDEQVQQNKHLIYEGD